MIQSLLWMAVLAPAQVTDGALLATTALNQAADQASTEPVLAKAPRELTFEVTPGVWLLRIRGDASNAPGNAPDLNLDTQLGLSELITAFRGEGIISRGDWSVRLAGSSFDTSGTTTADEFSQWGDILLVPGLEFTSTFDMAYVAAEARWQAWNPIGEKTLTDEHPLRLSLGPHVGISWLDIDQTLTAGTQTVSNGHSWWSVWGGGQVDLEFDMQRFVSWIDSIKVQAMAGLGGTPADGGFMWQVGGGVQVFFTHNIALSVGYRYEKYTLEDGDWEVNPNFQGLFLGGTVRF